MATPEQVQEIVRKVEEQQTRIAQLEVAMTQAVARGERAEQDRTALIRMLEEKSAGAGAGIVDMKGVGQPFKYNGKKDLDFAEWTHKLRVYLVAKYGDKIIRPLQWAARQRRIVVSTNDNGNDRMIAWSDEFGDGAIEDNKIIGIEQMITQLYTYLVSFTTGDANRVVRNAGEGQGLEAWRRLNNEYDPTSSMRRVTILGLVQNPPKCDKVENLGAALEEWLTRKRQYEEFTDKDGSPCRVSDDSLIAAMFKLMPKSLEETVMFKSDEYESFEILFDRLSSFASTKHSLKLEHYDRKNHNPDDMEIGAIGGKGKGKGDQRKGSVQCWVCHGYGHYGRDCPQRKGGSKGGKGKKKGGKEAGKGDKGGKKGKKGQSKGKSKKGDKGKLNSLEGSSTEHWVEQWWTENDQERRQWDWIDQAWNGTDNKAETQTHESLGGLDLCSMSSLDPNYIVEDGWSKWIKFNYDSGAATTAIPVEMAQGLPLIQQGEFKVASGESIPNMGKIKMQMQDEYNQHRGVRGSVTHVRKPLLSAGEVSKNYDSYLFEDGGMLLPKQSWIATSMRRHLRELCQACGHQGQLHLYLEGNVYNLYLKAVKDAELAAVDPKQVEQNEDMEDQDPHARHSWEGVPREPSGGRRQVYP